MACRIVLLLNLPRGMPGRMMVGQAGPGINNGVQRGKRRCRGAVLPVWSLSAGLRGKRADGSYVRCSPADSWNSDHVVSNLFLYQLQRHSDHHANPKLRYQSLRSAAEAPQLPAGYAVMIVIAWIPPLWRRVMDQRLLDYYDGDTERINVG